MITLDELSDSLTFWSTAHKKQVTLRGTHMRAGVPLFIKPYRNAFFVHIGECEESGDWDLVTLDELVSGPITPAELRDAIAAGHGEYWSYAQQCRVFLEAVHLHDPDTVFIGLTDSRGRPTGEFTLSECTDLYPIKAL